MAVRALAGDDLARGLSRRMSVNSSASRRGWASGSLREAFTAPGDDVFQRSGREDDEDELKRAAIERLPTYDRLKKGILKQVLDNGTIFHAEVDVANLGLQDKKHLMESILQVVEDDNERFLQRLRDRTDRVGIDIPNIEVRYENLSIEGDAYVGTRALPTLLNASVNMIEGILGLVKLFPSKKRVVNILQGVSGIVKPSRMTLLLGPPGSGKTTLLKALAGKTDKDLRVCMEVKGMVTYCGREMSEFISQRTCAYISQHDLHHGEMTVRETLDFSGRCLGVGTRYELLAELLRREKDAGIKPDPEIDAFMKATAVAGQESSLVTDYVLKILGLDICADIMVGDDMTRGISGGQKKRVTTGEMFFRQFLAFFGVHQMALCLFRFIAVLGRTQIVSQTISTFGTLIIFVLGGFIVSKDDLAPWMKWAYYSSPMMYGQNAIAIVEFLDKRWSTPNTDPRYPEPTVGKVLLTARGMFVDDYWYWICIAALFGFALLFNVLFIAALTYLKPLGDTKSIIVDEADESKNKKQPYSNTKGATDRSSASTATMFEGIDMAVRNSSGQTRSSVAENENNRRGMVLPFQPLSLAFDRVNYYVDMPAEMKSQGIEETRLQLLRDVSGAFRPGVLTALVGVSGAGKTTLMDVLAGRKTGGYIEGSISISGYPKNQATFARVSGYCEQNDIHSPYVTVYESLIYSAWLRLSKDVNKEMRKVFVEEVMALVELSPLRDSLVGLPGVDGLSTEQRKRLTIAVELVANPSIIFMDEPTSGLDARAAAIVMRTVRNTVDTGRTVVCTIHQPSIDIFEAFDELFLMKRGGQAIYAGPLGGHSHLLIEYFQSIRGVPKIKDGYNPATWMLEISSTGFESKLNVDFADIYANSDLYRRNQKLIKDLSTPAPGSQDLFFPTKYSQPFVTQLKACFWKQYWSYWRNPQYNAIRYYVTIGIGVLFGVIFWQKGNDLHKEQDLMNLLGAIYAAVFFLGATNTCTVQPVVAVERTVFYRERAAGMYSALPYAFAQVAIEAIYVSIQTLLYGLLLYSMIGFPWELSKFLWFYYYITMCFMYMTLYGMMVVALTPNIQIASIAMSFFLSFWNLFSGFLLPRTQIPIWWRWYYWASPIAWTIYGLLCSQLGDKTNEIKIPKIGYMTVKDYFKNTLGFDYDFLGVVAVAHIGWALLFFFVFVYSIKSLNFQRR
ncbi:pleiotropic drug resistance 6 [Actinidia rufa]|uniref:Pleiotropic drug resistance 6 n=1 Tax=Actinidia rufa TaxID=165716 RepID=A0A7J0GK62_9ERIC|nr:pleiotropic drug resistance 6 [Actinidia rufa]